MPKRGAEPWHGKHGYTNHACRCDECCEAHYERQREYRRNMSRDDKDARNRRVREWRRRRRQAR